MQQMQLKRPSRQQILQAYANPRRERRRINPFVTISRQPGAYGITIADLLSADLQKREKRYRFKWTVYDRELLRRVIEDHEMSPDVLPYLGEYAIGEINDMMEEFFGLHPSKWQLIHMMTHTILQLAMRGGAIFVGRATNVITSHLPGGVHIRLIGSYEARLEHLIKHKHFSEANAREFIRTEEKNRREYHRKYFSRDIDDPLLYDMVINTDSVPIQELVPLIAGFLFQGGLRREAPHE